MAFLHISDMWSRLLKQLVSYVGFYTHSLGLRALHFKPFSGLTPQCNLASLLRSPCVWTWYFCGFETYPLPYSFRIFHPLIPLLERVYNSFGLCFNIPCLRGCGEIKPSLFLRILRICSRSCPSSLLLRDLPTSIQLFPLSRFSWFRFSFCLSFGFSSWLPVAVVSLIF